VFVLQQNIHFNTYFIKKFHKPIAFYLAVLLYGQLRLQSIVTGAIYTSLLETRNYLAFTVYLCETPAKETVKGQNHLYIAESFSPVAI
jgi:hypothetical protein